MTVHVVFSLHDFLVAGAATVSAAVLVAWLHDRL